MEINSAEDLQKIIKEELEEWQVYVLSVLTDQLKRKKLVLTGELLRSLQSEVVAKTSEQAVSYALAFQNQGRFRDMVTNSGKLPPLDVIEAFVKKTGLSKFDYVAGYQFSNRTPTETNAIRRVAWGIRMKMNRENRPPKRWFAKPFYSTIDRLIDGIVTRYAQETSNIMAAQLTR
jgi:hypothetical protein